MPAICDYIKQARTATKKTQQEMADLLKVKRTTYASWETTVIPGIDALLQIAEILSVDWVSLIDPDKVTGTTQAPSKNVLREINKIQTQLAAMDKKLQLIVQKIDK